MFAYPCRLCEVFALNKCKIDHTLHGGIASAAVYGAVVGATAVQIDSAIGMVVAHHTPWRAIRAGKQLSDSKGASAAIIAEAAVVAVRRSMRGFVAPLDVFRNPDAPFLRFASPAVPTGEPSSPFDLVLGQSGDDFAVMGMHFKLGLYEHQSASALQALISLLAAHPDVVAAGPAALRQVTVRIHEPAYSIIGKPEKLDPHTRQSADHSMVFIVATLLHHAFTAGLDAAHDTAAERDTTALWQRWMLLPHDYSKPALANAAVRHLMSLVVFEHGGPEFDAKYPEGIPTTVSLTLTDARVLASGLVMFPGGHARDTTVNVSDVLATKWRRLLGSVMSDADVEACLQLLLRFPELSPAELATFGSTFALKATTPFEDADA